MAQDKPQKQAYFSKVLTVTSFTGQGLHNFALKVTYYTSSKSHLE
jgi:hypothetical protein